MTLTLRAVAACLLAAASLLPACSDDFGEPCTFPNLPQCRPDPDQGTDATCVFSNSAQCDSRICAVYNGSNGFCTESCDPAAPACPENAVCELPPGAQQAICIPRTLFDQSN